MTSSRVGTRVNEDTKQLAIFCLAAVLGIAIISGSITWYSVHTNRQYIEAGYEQSTLHGASGVFWTKIRNDRKPTNESN